MQLRCLHEYLVWQSNQLRTKRETITVWVAILGMMGMLQPILAEDDIDRRYRESIRPLLAKYCDDCHSGTSAEAKLDTQRFTSPREVAQSWSTWQEMMARAHADEMPPKDHNQQPSVEEIQVLQKWTQLFRNREAERRRGDPGPISTRRLTNQEFNYSIRDLTGIDIRPARNFPVDPANELGFDNSADSLVIAPSMVTKYLDAAREVADHMLLAPDGIRFAPFPVVTDTDRDKYCVQRIVDFYRRQPVALDAYLTAAYSLRRQGTYPYRDEQLQRVALEFQLSLPYLRKIVAILHDSNSKIGPLADLRQRWEAIVDHPDNPQLVQQQCLDLAQTVLETRKKLTPVVKNLKGPGGMNGGSQTLVLWKNRRMASLRQSCRDDLFDAEMSKELLSESDLQLLEKDRDTYQPQLKEAYAQFCQLIPDAFFILERGRAHIDEKEAAREAKGRLLSAGFHSMMGYFRDDQPLCDLILSPEQNRELQRLWDELDFIALVPFRQYSGFIWYERAEASFINEEAFHFVRAEDKSANSDAMMKRFADTYVEKLHRREADPRVIEAVEFYFADMNRQIRSLESKLEQSQQVQLQSLLALASRAFRRPVTDREQKEILSFYERSRKLPNADHRSAMEDTLISILVSPSHLFRWDLQSQGSARVSLTPLELANRISFFVWSSIPDAPLQQAIATQWDDASMRRQQLHRMLNDDRLRGMAREFLGNWLEFRRFDQHNGVDREQFPEFTDELRQAMAEEPIEYFMELVRSNGRLFDLLDSDHVVVNRTLAKHYGIEWPSNTDPNQWIRIEGARAHHRGGLVPMGVFLTQNSPGLRTSPVKRGYWVVRKLLGEKIPPPPPNVPELPASEHQLGDLTLRELLAKHREHPSCGSCHDRFDGAGLLLEGFDPIGRPRSKDLAGRPIADDGILPKGLEARGLQGLKDYLNTQRREDFRRHFCQSLLSFALGRNLILSDDLLIQEMLQELSKNDDKIQTAWDVILRSEPFLTKRSAEVQVE